MNISLNDDELIEKSRQGDLVAFEALIAKYEKKVYTIAFRFMGNHADASDLAQEAFIRVYKSLNSFRAEASFLTWLNHIVANVCRDDLRKRKKQNTVSLEEVKELKKTNLAASQNIPEETIMLKERQEALQDVINSLPVDFKWIIIMREFQDFSYEEIASQIGCSIGTVKSRLSRARQLLREKVLKRQDLFFGYQLDSGERRS